MAGSSTASWSVTSGCRETTWAGVTAADPSSKSAPANGIVIVANRIVCLLWFVKHRLPAQESFRNRQHGFHTACKSLDNDIRERQSGSCGIPEETLTVFFVEETFQASAGFPATLCYADAGATPAT